MTCSGACSNTTPRCPSGIIVDTTAPGQCRSVDDHPNTTTIPFSSGFGGIDTTQNVPMACAGPARFSVSIENLEHNQGLCEGGFADGSPANCTVFLHAAVSQPLVRFTCGITVRSGTRIPQCGAPACGRTLTLAPARFVSA